MMKKNNGFMLGTAIATSLMSTLSTVLGRYKEPKSWAAQARMFANNLVEKEDRTRRNVVLGSVAGGLIGVAAALLYAQRSGVNLRKTFQKEIHKTTSKAKKSVKKVVRKAKSTVAKAKKKGKELKVETLKHFA